MNDDFTTEDYIRQLKVSPDPDERLYAAFKLGRDRQSIVIQPLIEAANDVEVNVRVRVAEALGTREEAHLVLPALDKLIRDSDPLVRRTAADSMGKVGSEQAAPSLCLALEDADASVRSHAAEALGKIRGGESAEALVEAFLHDDDANVRYFSKQSLAQVGSAAVPAILAIIADNQKPDLLVEFCEILGTIADTQSISVLETLTMHDDEEVAEMAQWALARIIR